MNDFAYDAESGFYVHVPTGRPVAIAFRRDVYVSLWEFRDVVKVLCPDCGQVHEHDACNGLRGPHCRSIRPPDYYVYVPPRTPLFLRYGILRPMTIIPLS
jgi:hypothetical protein